MIAAVGAGVFAAGCLSGSESSPETQQSDNETDDAGHLGATTEFSSGDDLPTAKRDLPVPADLETMRDELLMGAAKDSIPAIDDPRFIDAEEGDELVDDGDPVFGIFRNGEAKAYSQHILVWHEIVNDVIGGNPITMTYCPLTGTAQGFERGEAVFGVSGQLLNSNLVMFDRSTETYWPQMLGLGIKGPHEEDELAEFDVVWTTWERWRSAYPDTRFLSEDTGYARDYGRDPYGSYNPRRGHYNHEILTFPQFGSGSDHEFHRKRVFLGARGPEGALAVAKDTLSEVKLDEAEVGGVPFVVVYDDELDTGWFYRNPDNVSITVRGETVTVDRSSYAPDDLPLEPVVRYDAMWFAWEGYYPDTEVIA